MTINGAIISAGLCQRDDDFKLKKIYNLKKVHSVEIGSFECTESNKVPILSFSGADDDKIPCPLNYTNKEFNFKTSSGKFL